MESFDIYDGHNSRHSLRLKYPT